MNVKSYTLGLWAHPAARTAQIPSETLQLWLKSIVLSALWAILFVVGYGVERYIFGVDKAHRLFDDPGGMSVYLIGLAHGTIAISFLLSSNRVRSLSGSLWLFVLCLLSGGISLAIYYSGGVAHPFIMFAIFTYFMVHDLRDWIFFYGQSKEFPSGNREQDLRVLHCLKWIVIVFVFAVAMPSYLNYQYLKGRAPNDAFMKIFFPSRFTFVEIRMLYLLPALALLAVMVIHVHRINSGGWPAIWMRHRPMVALLLAYLAIILGAVAINIPAVIAFVVLLHFVGWYVFALDKAKQHPGRERIKNPFMWLRKTSAGLHVAHLGLVGIFLVVLGIASYNFGHDTIAHTLLGEYAFWYWTVFHITNSFVPR